MSLLARPKIDCHCHVLDPKRFPYQEDTRYRPSGQEVAPYESLVRIMDLYGVRHAVLVGTNSGYGEDSSPVLDALRRAPDRFKGVAVVANDISAAELSRLKAAGMIGVAFNTPYHGTAHYAASQRLLKTLVDDDLLLNIQVRDDQLLDLMPLLEKSDVRLVIDHCGRPKPGDGPDQPGFKTLLELGRSGRAAVKLSGFGQFSLEPYPHADAAPYIQALLAAFTPERCVWGSDWPFLRAPERVDYAPLLMLIDALLPEESDKQKVFWETPRRVFGFAD